MSLVASDSLALFRSSVFARRCSFQRLMWGVSGMGLWVAPSFRRSGRFAVMHSFVVTCPDSVVSRPVSRSAGGV